MEKKKKLDVDQKHTKIIILWNTTNYKENPNYSIANKRETQNYIEQQQPENNIYIYTHHASFKKLGKCICTFGEWIWVLWLLS